jgi:hypothetical protein
VPTTPGVASGRSARIPPNENACTACSRLAIWPSWMVPNFEVDENTPASRFCRYADGASPPPPSSACPFHPPGVSRSAAAPRAELASCAGLSPISCRIVASAALRSLIWSSSSPTAATAACASLNSGQPVTGPSWFACENFSLTESRSRTAVARSSRAWLICSRTALSRSRSEVLVAVAAMVS